MELAEKRKKKRLATLELDGYQKGDLLDIHLKKSKRKINKTCSTFNVINSSLRSGASFREKGRMGRMDSGECTGGVFHESLEVHG